MRTQAMLVSPVAAGLFVAVVATPLVIGEGGRAAFAAAVKDPLSLLTQRSPGERAPGAMHSTKGPRARVAGPIKAGPVTPRERVLPAIRERAPEVPTPASAAAPEAGLPVVEAPIQVAEAPPAPFLAPPFFGPNVLIPGAGPNPGPGPGPGPGPQPDPGPGPGPGPEPDPGPGPGPGPGPDPEVPPVVPVVPEPATWAMLLAGFFATGAALRRRARQPALKLAGRTLAR